MDQPRGGVTGGAGEPDADELLAALPVAVLLVDPAGRVTQANGAAELLLNQSERTMRGMPLDYVVRVPGVAARRAEQGFAAFDALVETARGGRRRVDYVEAALAERPGWRVVTLHHAATVRRMGHPAERGAGARAAVGAAAMLAHEIKNPLSGIRGAAQLLQADGAGDGELTRLITDEVDRITALIDRMQDLTDTRPLRSRAENIYPLLDHARRVALAGFARGIVIDERFDPSLPEAWVDRDALLQILLNLIKNAVEALAEVKEPRIVLATAYRHGMSASTVPGRPRQPLPIELSVIDNGPGAPADIADHLFEPFVSGKSEGKGLGLSLVEKLVRDMGGIVQYAREGEPEMTVFRILLPRAPRT